MGYTPERRWIYVASSWSNPHHPEVVRRLAADGHLVYDFRNPTEGNSGFHWRDIGLSGDPVGADAMVEALRRPRAVEGFALDFGAMQASDTCVLVLPCGRSAHLEAGWFVGQGRELHILWLDDERPDLMVQMATKIHSTVDSVVEALRTPFEGVGSMSLESRRGPPVSERELLARRIRNYRQGVA